MKLLVDTHALLWSLIEPEKLSARVRRALRSPDNTSAVSAISFWEISLKVGIGKLELTGIEPERLPVAAEQAGYDIIGLLPVEAASFHRLPQAAHKDPFDRMIAWQAIGGGYTLVSKDRSLKAYEPRGLQLFW